MSEAWGGEVETGVSADVDTVTGEVIEPEPPRPDYIDPRVIDINTMSTEEMLELADHEWGTVLKQVVAELGAVGRKRVELAPYYYEYKGLQERERTLTSMKSAIQSLLRTARI